MTGVAATLLANLAATLFLTGIGWSLQLVQLPLLFRGDYPELVRQLALHRTLNSRLIALPMLVEFITAVWLVIEHPTSAVIAALVLWLPVGYATVWYSLLHRQIKKGYNRAIMERMKLWNLVRTLCWTARAGILLWTIAGQMGI